MHSRAQARLLKPASLVLGSLLALAVLALMPDLAHAAAGAGGGMPWEEPLDQLRASVTGPVAFVVSLIGIVVAGAILIFGSDLNAFFRTMVLIVMIISILIAAQNWLAGTFGRGASIATAAHHRQEA